MSDGRGLKLGAMAVVSVVVFAALAGLGVFSWGGGTSGAQEEAPGPGSYSKVFTYEVRTMGHPGLANTETYAALGCDPGDKLLSGGFSKVDEGTAVIASAPEPLSSSEDWLVGWENDATPDAVEVIVLCAEGAFPPHEEASGRVADGI